MPPPPPSPPPPYSGDYAAQPSASGYANWGLRVVARLLDSLAGGVPYGICALLGQAIGGAIGALLVLVGVAWAIYFLVRTIIVEGRTGQAFGKSVMGIKLISEQTGSPIGGGMVFGRHFVHILDGIPCYLGYLWPLWDKKRQTFADKILSTIVVAGPKSDMATAFMAIAKP